MPNPDDVETPALGRIDLGKWLSKYLRICLSCAARKFVKHTELERHDRLSPRRMTPTSDLIVGLYESIFLSITTKLQGPDQAGAPNRLTLPRANSVCGGEGANGSRSETRFSPGVSCLTNAGC
jgi:hypothetical protein